MAPALSMLFSVREERRAGGGLRKTVSDGD